MDKELIEIMTGLVVDKPECTIGWEGCLGKTSKGYTLVSGEYVCFTCDESTRAELKTILHDESDWNPESIGYETLHNFVDDN